MAFQKNEKVFDPADLVKILAIRWPVLLVFLLGAVTIFFNLGKLSLISPDEGRNAEVAREMSLSGAWLTPTYDGVAYLDKPAFYFKTVAISFALFGESEATARLSSAVFGFSLLIALFLFCRRVYDERTAILATAVAATTPLFIAFSRLVIFDMTLAFFVCSTLFCCYIAEEYEDKRRSRWYLAGAFCAGIATLVKGPVGFLVPSLVIVIFNVVDRRKGAIKRCFAFPNWVVFLCIFVPWFVGLSIDHPDFPYYGVMKESLSRFATKEFHRTKPFYYYGVILASCFFAWSVLLPESVVAAWRARNRWNSPDRFFLVWTVVVVVFFSISQSKLPGYILSVAASLGALTARVFVGALANGEGAGSRIVRHGTLALATLSLVAAFVALALVLNPDSVERRLAMKHEIAELFSPAFPSLALSFGLIGLAALFSYLSKSPSLAFVAFLGLPLLLVTLNIDALTIFSENRSSRDLAGQISAHLEDDTEIACLECMPNGLPFYAKRLITVISKDGSELTSNYILFSLASGKQWPERIVELDSRDAWLASRNHPVYLMAGARNVPVLHDIAARYGARVNQLLSGYSAVLLPSLRNH